jgi:hypothetical protein
MVNEQYRYISTELIKEIRSEHFWELIEYVNQEFRKAQKQGKTITLHNKQTKLVHLI